MFCQAFENPIGFEKVMQAMEDFKQFKGEKRRFETLINAIIFSGPSSTALYQVNGIDSV